MTRQLCWLAIDYENATTTVRFSDGTEASEALASAAESKEIRRLTYDVEERLATLTITGMGDITAEVGDGGDELAARRGRPVVYLDQNHWISLARCLYNPAKLSATEVGPSRRLIEMARAEQLILPLSGAHHVEAARSDGTRRRDLAHTMLELSRGWQMRSPLLIRHDEIQLAFDAVAAHPTSHGPLQPVFTLAPNALFGPMRRQDAGDPPATEYDGTLGDLGERLTWLCSIYAVLAEDELEDRPEGQKTARAWATSNHDVALYVGAHPEQRKHLRRVSMMRTIVDLTDEFSHNASECGVTPEGFGSWLVDGAETSFAQMPYLGRIREITHMRFANAQDRWEPNDLNDMHFLGCAAGYADIVVGENKFSDYLQRVARLRGEGAGVASNLQQAVPMIEALLVPAPQPTSAA